MDAIEKRRWLERDVWMGFEVLFFLRQHPFTKEFHLNIIDFISSCLDYIKNGLLPPLDENSRSIFMKFKAYAIVLANAEMSGALRPVGELQTTDDPDICDILPKELCQLYIPSDVIAWASKKPTLYPHFPFFGDAAPPIQTDGVASEKPLGIEDTLNGVSDVPREKKATVQERRILEIIRDTGYDPLNFPANRLGYPGVKAEARKRALLEARTFTDCTFDSAWKRLRKNREIIDH